MGTYDALIEEADAERAAGRFKEAHIKYGSAIALGGGRNHYCRHMRGLCARLVAEQRMQKSIDHPHRRQEFLNQAARWLAKSEANLSSAYDESPEEELVHVRLEQARTEEAIARFISMSGAGDPARRLAAAEAYRAEGTALGSDQ